MNKEQVREEERKKRFELDTQFITMELELGRLMQELPEELKDDLKDLKEHFNKFNHKLVDNYAKEYVDKKEKEQ